MMHAGSQIQDLDESRFMSEQISKDQQPSEQEILQKAEELEIDDLALAKQALTKELDPQWRPYVNRKGEVYYINLEERKAYADHPVQMEIKITYALKYRKRVPVFREYAIEEISSSPKLVQEVIKNYQLEKGLNIVYEESQEESMRRDTQQSGEQSLQYSNVIEFDRSELDLFRLQCERKMKGQLELYKQGKQTEFTNRVKISKERLEDVKKEHLSKIAKSIQLQYDSKNEAAFKKATETTKEELLIKKYKLEDLHFKQLELLSQMQSSRQNKEEQIKAFYRKKILYQKQKLVEKISSQQTHSLGSRLMAASQEEAKSYERQSLQVIYNRINLRERFYENIDKLKADPVKSKQFKKRYSIFNSQVFCPQKKESKDSFESISQKLKINEYFQNKPLLYTDYPTVYGRSLTLRLSKKIL